jgi:hypothetical protein
MKYIHRSLIFLFLLILCNKSFAQQPLYAMPSYSHARAYASVQSSAKRPVHPALRFFIIAVGTFPLAYLISYPIILLATQNRWDNNRQITTALAIAGGISGGVSLLDLFLGLAKKDEDIYAAI